MSELECVFRQLELSFDSGPASESELAAAVFLARYSGRTLESYQADLRGLFQWTHAAGIDPLDALALHLELYRSSLEQRWTGRVDNRSATVNDDRLLPIRGHRRCASPANPAQHVRRPRVHPSVRRGMDRDELARFLYTAELTSARRTARWRCCSGLNGLRVSEACCHEH